MSRDSRMFFQSACRFQLAPRVLVEETQKLPGTKIQVGQEVQACSDVFQDSADRTSRMGRKLAAFGGCKENQTIIDYNNVSQHEDNPRIRKHQTFTG